MWDCGAVRARATHAAAAALYAEHRRGWPAACPTPPLSRSCPANRWAPGLAFPLPDALAICSGVAAALAHLHARRVCHGDVYAHNVLWDAAGGRAVLCDLGEGGGAARATHAAAGGLPHLPTLHVPCWLPPSPRPVPFCHGAPQAPRSATAPRRPSGS